MILRVLAFCYRENALPVIEFYIGLCLVGITYSVSIEGANSRLCGQSLHVILLQQTHHYRPFTATEAGLAI